MKWLPLALLLVGCPNRHQEFASEMQIIDDALCGKVTPMATHICDDLYEQQNHYQGPFNGVGVGDLNSLIKKCQDDIPDALYKFYKPRLGEDWECAQMEHIIKGMKTGTKAIKRAMVEDVMSKCKTK